MGHSVLIVDDEPTQRRLIEHVVGERLGYKTVSAAGGQEAIDYIYDVKQPDPDVILLDLVMPKVTGMDVIHAVHAVKPHIPIIVLTMHGDMDRAAAAVKAGAHDFLAKPVPLERLSISIKNALHVNTLNHEVVRLQRSVCGQIFFSDLIGQSGKMQEAVGLGQRAASSSVPVLIGGEKGVGRELFARAVHGCGERAGRPFVTVNCAAVPEHLMESVLFGHEKGAFSGAIYRTMGKFREAEGGTLFLSDIDALTPDLQVKLLHALAAGEVHPLGGKSPVKVNVRLISTTGRDLSAAVRNGEFREDLFYRVNMFPVTLPPLRERREDIPLLAEHFLGRFAAQEHKNIKSIDGEAMEYLKNCLWPGNVHELENALFRAVVLSHASVLSVEDFAVQMPPAAAARNGHGYPMLASMMTGHLHGSAASLPIVDHGGNVKTLEEIEAELIQFALKHYDGHMSEVARRLGIGRSTLYRKLNDMRVIPMPMQVAAN